MEDNTEHDHHESDEVSAIRASLASARARVAELEAELIGRGAGRVDTAVDTRHTRIVVEPVVPAALEIDHLLAGQIFPYLEMKDLGWSAAPVCRRWREASNLDQLWRSLSEERWPELMKTLANAGVPVPNYLSFCRARLRRLHQQPPAFADNEAVWVLVDMPNLVKAGEGGPATPLRPLHLAFRLDKCFREITGDYHTEHQQIFDEGICRCVQGGGHDHSSSWLHCPIHGDYFPRPSLNKDATAEEVFGMKISLLRESDGKIATIVQPGSSGYDIEAPDRFNEPWTIVSQSLRVLEHRAHPRSEDEGDDRYDLKVMAGMDSTISRQDYFECFKGSECRLHDALFKVQHVVFGFQCHEPLEDEYMYGPHMVPPTSVDELNWFFENARLSWV